MTVAERRQRCKKLCPAKQQCSCEGETHALHICSNRDCYCHTAARYAAERERLAQARTTDAGNGTNGTNHKEN